MRGNVARKLPWRNTEGNNIIRILTIFLIAFVSGAFSENSNSAIGINQTDLGYKKQSISMTFDKFLLLHKLDSIKIDSLKSELIYPKRNTLNNLEHKIVCEENSFIWREQDSSFIMYLSKFPSSKIKIDSAFQMSKKVASSFISAGICLGIMTSGLLVYKNASSTGVRYVGFGIQITANIIGLVYCYKIYKSVTSQGRLQNESINAYDWEILNKYYEEPR